MTKYPVKITVVKLVRTGLCEEYGLNVSPDCPRFKVGDEFLMKADPYIDMPEGFCSWAWADIQRDVVHLSLGGDIPWVRQKGTMISCCTDGFRPVIFKLERMERM
jgi:uncharacterized repeat protein (TIGR04076 family)